MASPSPTVRRRAWINSSRQWPTLEELDPEGPPCNLPSASIADDDVFSDGCFTGKIENWLLRCGSQDRSENTGQLSFGVVATPVRYLPETRCSSSPTWEEPKPAGLREMCTGSITESVLKANNFDDELSLGADASALNDGGVTSKPGLTRQASSKQGHSKPTSSTPRQGLCLPSLNLGHSMASSCFSSSTCKTTSSISEVLQLCSEDAEETLYELGFGCDEPQVTVRIPPRFFTFPSVAQGINFRLFLDSQLRRIREEDPSLSLASRFRQVQVLTAMANAFYSLYSHVSRTPLQKLVTPEFTFSSSSLERMERFRSSVRSEPRSPVERLKDTVSKMCLYTGSPRGSDSTSPQPSPRKRSSLPEVVDIVLETVKTGTNKKLDLGENNESNSAMDVWLETGGDKSCNSEKEKETQQTVADTDTLQSGNTICCKEIQGSKQTDNVDAENSVKPADLDSRTHSVRTSVASSLSGETVIETCYHLLSYQPELDPCLAQSDTSTVHLKPAAKVTYDLISPQIVESVHQAPFRTQSPKTSTSPPVCPETESIDRSCPGSHKLTTISEPEEDSHEGDVSRPSRSLPAQATTGSYTQCCITVTGWEGDDVSSCSLNAPDSSHTSAVPPAQTCEESLNEGKTQYLNPLTHQGPGPVSNNLQQVNSFELEEVHSAGEEDFGQSQITRTTTSPLSRKRQYNGEVVRGDSMQSDSSGYADEEVSPSSNTHSR